MSENQTRFMNAHRRLESELRRVTGLGNGVLFHQLLDAAESRMSIVRRYRRRIDALHGLRNVLAHHGWDHGEPIAEPLPAVVAEIERIAAELAQPPPLPP